MPMICNIPKEDTYDLPEGRYNAVLASVRIKPDPKTNRSDQQQIRLLFNVSIPSMKRKNPMAGRSFSLDLKKGSDLRNLIESWMGTEWFDSNTTVDFERLIGRSADLTLTHHHNDGYNRPFVNIESIHPVGSLKLTEQPPAVVEENGNDNDSVEDSADDWRMVP